VRTDEFIATVDGYHKGVGTLKAMLAEEESKAKDAAFVYKLGEKLFAHGRTDDADARFAKVVELDPANATGHADDAMMDRASICQKNKNWDGAIAHCQDLMKRFTTSELVADAAISVAYFHENAGRKPEAIAAYKEFIARWPESGDVEFAREQIKGLETPAAAY